MQGVQSSYKTDRGVKGKSENVLWSVGDYESLLCNFIGGATGNIRARFEQMGKQDDDVRTL